MKIHSAVLWLILADRQTKMVLLTGPNFVSVPNTSEIIHLARIIQDKKGKQSVRPGGVGSGGV
jgi:hypothetical protein